MTRFEIASAWPRNDTLVRATRNLSLRGAVATRQSLSDSLKAGLLRFARNDIQEGEFRMRKDY